MNLRCSLKLNLPNTSHPSQEPILADQSSKLEHVLLAGAARFLPSEARRGPTIVLSPSFGKPLFRCFRGERTWMQYCLVLATLRSVSLLYSFSCMEHSLQLLHWAARWGLGFGLCWQSNGGGSPISWLRCWWTPRLIHTLGFSCLPKLVDRLCSFSPQTLPLTTASSVLKVSPCQNKCSVTSLLCSTPAGDLL